jgi:signal transduction histidine kinase
MVGQLLPALAPSFAAYVGVFGAVAVACAASLARVGAVEDADTRRGLAALLVASGLWATAHVAFLVAPWPGVKLAAYYVGLAVGFAAVGPWLYFCSAYTGRSLHRNPFYRRAAVALLAVVLGLKFTNPIHGLYFSAAPTTAPFPHLAVRHHLLHWLAMGLSYTLAAVGYFMLLELFTQTGYDTRPLAFLLGLTALPLVFDIVGRQSTVLLDMTYEPLGVAAFAVGTLFLFFERFQAVQLASGIDDPVVFLDDDGVIRDVNRPAVALFPALGGTVGDRLDAHLPALARRLDDDERVLELERDDETRYFMLSSNPFSFGSTRVGRMLLIDDVTREERYRREIERQNERLGQFAGVISHDLRNPLNVATGRLELERERRDSENLEAVAAALDRMDRLIEDLLALAREGQDIGEQRPVSLAAVAEDAWGTVADEEADLIVDADAAFRADADRLRQLLENLFRNALEHAGADVTVTVGPLEGGFYVADDGPGIPPDERETVTEFGHSVAGGSGLGLAIVDTIAEAHGWELTVTESATGGARFEFTGAEAARDDGTEATMLE